MYPRGEFFGKCFWDDSKGFEVSSRKKKGFEGATGMMIQGDDIDSQQFMH